LAPKRLARALNRQQAALALRLWHACIAVSAPAL
jgi:hypothetical protein